MKRQHLRTIESTPNMRHQVICRQRKRSTFCFQLPSQRRSERLLWNLVVVTVVANFVILSVECFVAIVTPATRFHRQPYRNSPMILSLEETGRNNRFLLLAVNNKLQFQSESPISIVDTCKTSATAVAIPFQDRYADLLLSPWEQWCVQQLQQRYDEALSIKCPFFRRRASDILDAVDMIVRFIVIRHKSLPDYAMLPSIYNPRRHSDSSSLTSAKFFNITQDELLSILRDDWKAETHKGYYITGKLTTAIYSDDALFDGPDPDMPVRGLYKYMNAASQLFEVKSSYSELLDIRIESDVSIVARWKLYGKLRLPWKPVVPAWTGTTTYHIDPRHGLIDRHIETWDISVWQAFLQTLCPPIARQIWR